MFVNVCLSAAGLCMVVSNRSSLETADFPFPASLDKQDSYTNIHRGFVMHSDKLLLSSRMSQSSISCLKSVKVLLVEYNHKHSYLNFSAFVLFCIYTDVLKSRKDTSNRRMRNGCTVLGGSQSFQSVRSCLKEVLASATGSGVVVAKCQVSKMQTLELSESLRLLLVLTSAPASPSELPMFQHMLNINTPCLMCRIQSRVE